MSVDLAPAHLPRVLVIDDLFGRRVAGGPNREREDLCASLLFEEIGSRKPGHRTRVIRPIAAAEFLRGQQPVTAAIGDIVENDLEGSLAKIRQGWTEALARGDPPWTMVLLDLCFYTGRVTEESQRRAPGMPEGRPGDDDPRGYFGLTLLDAIHRQFPDLPVMILSSKRREDVSLEFSRRGALGFVARDDLLGAELLEEAFWQHGLLPDAAGEVVGNSLPLLLALREARRAAGHRENLLLRGERGTGKELLARYASRMRSRAGPDAARPLVTVNSAVLAPALFASELFGIEPNTATGVDGKRGLIEMAHGGDLFLDEIADMRPEVQAAVLRVLQDREITPVGARKPRMVDVRFLAATNANLENEERAFRPDLLDRLRLGGTLWLPALRGRPADIPLLAERFVREAEAQRLGAASRRIAQETLAALSAYEWPGNIRELRSAIFDAVHRHPDVEHLVVGHLRLGTRNAEHQSAERSPYKKERGISRPRTGAPQEPGIANLLACLEKTTFEARDIGQWAGRLGEIQHETAQLCARMISAALEITKRRTPGRPGGVVQIHPAMKLATGDPDLTASQAADALKRLLRPLEKELDGDLRDAYETAVRLRPKAAGGSVRKNPAPEK